MYIYLLRPWMAMQPTWEREQVLDLGHSKASYSLARLLHLAFFGLVCCLEATYRPIDL